MADRPPLPVWGKERVTLLGDAARAMLPYLDQCGCTALEDAVSLAQLIKKNRAAFSITTLRTWKKLRHQRTAPIPRQARHTGNARRPPRLLHRACSQMKNNSSHVHYLFTLFR